MTDKSISFDAALRGITVDGEPLANVLEEEERQADAEELAKGEKHFLLKKPYDRYVSPKLRPTGGRSFGRMGVMREFFSRIIKELSMQEYANKTHYIIAALLTGKTLNATDITNMLLEQGLTNVRRGDVTSILSRLMKSVLRRYVSVNKTRQPYIYKAVEEFCNAVSVMEAANLYNSKHPLSLADLERKYPQLKGVRAPDYIEPAAKPSDAPDPDESGGLPDEPAADSASGRMVAELGYARDVSIHISFGPIRILFGFDKGESQYDDR